jgi:hypothetical protein
VSVSQNYADIRLYIECVLQLEVPTPVLPLLPFIRYLTGPEFGPLHLSL